MKLGLKYQEAGFGTSSLEAINKGAWTLASNFPTDLGKILKCAAIPEDDGNSIALAFKYIPEGMLVMLAKRISMRGRVSRGIQALWIFIPQGCDISTDQLYELIEKAGRLFESPLNFASNEKFEKAASSLIDKEYGGSSKSIASSGNMKGGEFAIMMNVAPLTLNDILGRGMSPEYSTYGLIILNNTGVNTTPVATIELPQEAPESVRQPSDKSATELPPVPDIPVSDSSAATANIIKESDPLKRVLNANVGVGMAQSVNIPDIPATDGHEESVQGLSPLENHVAEGISSMETAQEEAGSGGGFAPIAPDPIIPPSYYEEYDDTATRKRNIILMASILLIIIGIGWWLYYDMVYLPQQMDKNAQIRYPVVAMPIHSETSDNFKLLGVAPYGRPVMAYETTGKWTKIKYVPEGKNSKPLEGYVESDKLLDTRDYELLNSIFNSNEARDKIDEGRERLALLEYFKNQDIAGVMSANRASELGLTSDPYRQWQIFSHYGSNIRPSEVLFKNEYFSYGDNRDMAVIIENVESGRKKLLFFTFDDDETPHLRLDTNFYGSGIMDFYVKENGRRKQLVVKNQNGNTETFGLN